MYGTGLLPVRRDCLPLATKKVLKCFQHCVFVVPLLLLAAGVGFLLLVFDEENVLLLKYNQSRITQARDKQVEDKHESKHEGLQSQRVR